MVSRRQNFELQLCVLPLVLGHQSPLEAILMKGNISASFDRDKWNKKKIFHAQRCEAQNRKFNFVAWKHFFFTLVLRVSKLENFRAFECDFVLSIFRRKSCRQVQDENFRKIIERFEFVWKLNFFFVWKTRTEMSECLVVCMFEHFYWFHSISFHF